jgi:hypothetical protein
MPEVTADENLMAAALVEYQLFDDTVDNELRERLGPQVWAEAASHLAVGEVGNPTGVTIDKLSELVLRLTN